MADIYGSVYQLNEDFETTKAWIAHSNGRVTHMLERNGLLVALGVRPELFVLRCTLTGCRKKMRFGIRYSRFGTFRRATRSLAFPSYCALSNSRAVTVPTPSQPSP